MHCGFCGDPRFGSHSPQGRGEPARGDTNTQAWERAAKVPLTLDAVVFLAAFAVRLNWWLHAPSRLPTASGTQLPVSECETLVWVGWTVAAPGRSRRSRAASQARGATGLATRLWGMMLAC